jgi:tetratricopeptide (TPR) repeat protein
MTAGQTQSHLSAHPTGAGHDPQFGAVADALTRAEPDLAFTPLGILALDVLLAARWGEGPAPLPGADSPGPWRPSPERGREIARFGIWLGEALRRTLGGAWARAPEAPGDVLKARLLLPDGQAMAPVQLVLRRAREGRRARIWPIYQHLRRQAGHAMMATNAELLARGRYHLDAGHAVRAVPFLEEALWTAAADQAADLTECALCLDQARWDLYRWGEHTPEDCNFAGLAIAFATTLGEAGIRADFTAASIAALDLWLLENFGAAPLPVARQDVAGRALAGIAAYLGEVLCRCLDARWEPDPTAPRRPRLLLPGGGRLCPSAEVERRFTLGKAGGLYPRLVESRQGLKKRGLLLDLPDPALDWLAQAEALALTLRWRGAAAQCARQAERATGAAVLEARIQACLAAALAPPAETTPRTMASPTPAQPPEATEISGTLPLRSAAPVQPAPPTPSSTPPNESAALPATMAPVAASAPPPPPPPVDPARAAEAAALREAALRETDQGHTREAMVLYRQVVALDPTDGESWREAGVGHALLGEMEEALACFDGAIAAEPQEPKSYDHKAVTLGRMGDFAAGLAVLTAGLAVCPEAGASALWSRQTFYLTRVGRLEEAVASGARACALAPEDPQAWLFRAQAEQGLGRIPEAIAAFGECADRLRYIHPENAVGVMRMRWKLEHPDRPLDTERATVLMDEAWQLYGQGDRLGAAACLQEAVLCDPFQHEAWSNLGVLLGQSQQIAEALACFVRATGIWPTNHEYAYSQARALEALERVEEALAVHEEVLAHWPKDRPSLAERARLLLRLKRLEEAVAALDTCLALITGNDAVAILDRKSYCLAELKRFPEALAAIDAAIEIRPGDRKLWLAKSLRLGDLGRHDEAEDLQREAFSDPEFAEEYHQEGLRQLQLLFGEE